MRKETDNMANDSLKDFLAAGDSGDEREFTSGEDFYQLYLEELKLVPPCSPEEEERLLDEILAGSQSAVKRLVEGKLGRAVRMAEEYRDRGLDERSGAGGEYRPASYGAGIQGGRF